jgi:hypothetical protein
MDAPPTNESGSLRSASAVRVLMLLLGLSALAAGAFMTLWPRVFYRDVPGVDLLPPYNGHMLGDVGGFYVGFGVAFACAAAWPTRELVGAISAAWTVTQGLHLTYHLLHLEGFGTGVAIVQTVILVAAFPLPLIALWLIRTPGVRASLTRHHP